MQMELIRRYPDRYRLLSRVPQKRERVFTDEGLKKHERVVIFVDFETTGVKRSDVPIELGAVKAIYCRKSGRIKRIIDRLQMYEDPKRKLSPKIVGLTKITDEMVKGKKFNILKVLRFFDGDPLMVAHHAGFDAKVWYRRFPQLRGLRWACSCKDIDWKKWLDSDSPKLELLALKAGRFYNAHRATVDCYTVAELCAGIPGAFSELLDNLKAKKELFFAWKWPYVLKDELKDLGGWTWDSDNKVWWRPYKVKEFDQLKAEMVKIWKGARRYGRGPRVSNRDLYSLGA